MSKLIERLKMFLNPDFKCPDNVRGFTCPKGVIDCTDCIQKYEG